MTQLSLFDPVEPEFSQHIRRTNHKGETFYSLVDIIETFADNERAARKVWSDTKKRLIADGFELSGKIGQLKLPASDGKSYKTDCANAETCLRIVQSIPSPKAEPIRRWLATLGFERLQEEAQPGLASQRARQRDLTRLQKAGYSKHEAVERLEIRIQGIDTFKSLSAQIARVCEAPRYGQIIDQEYVALLGATTAELRTLLHTKSVRDDLPGLQLSYIQTAEQSLSLILKRIDHMTNAQILHVIDQVCRPLGEHLALICNLIGVHQASGQMLIAGEATHA